MGIRQGVPHSSGFRAPQAVERAQGVQPAERRLALAGLRFEQRHRGRVAPLDEHLLGLVAQPAVRAVEQGDQPGRVESIQSRPGAAASVPAG